MKNVLLPGQKVTIPCEGCDKCPVVSLDGRGEFVTVADDFGGTVKIPRAEFEKIQRIRLMA